MALQDPRSSKGLWFTIKPSALTETSCNQSKPFVSLRYEEARATSSAVNKSCGQNMVVFPLCVHIGFIWFYPVQSKGIEVDVNG